LRIAGEGEEALLEFGAGADVQRREQDRELGPGTVETMEQFFE
jgi:hypothetical protein